LKNLQETKLEDLQGRTSEIIRVLEMLCEVCEKPLDRKEKPLGAVQILNREDCQNLLERAQVHERAEIEVEKRALSLFPEKLLISSRF
jgi:hypothetical protein